MSQQRRLYRWRQEVAAHFPHWSRPQTHVLSAFTFGLALAKRCTLSRVAEVLAFWGKPDTVERRLQRFLANPRVDWQAGAQALAAWVLACWAHQGHTTLVLVVDETSLRDRLKVMAVGVAYRGRAIPLAWACYRQGQAPRGQVALIRHLLAQVAPAVPAGTRVVVQVDRGIGNSPDLLRGIAEMGWYYLARVSRGVRLRLEDGRVVPIGAQAPRPGARWTGAVEAFKKAGWLRCWAHACWKQGQREPWLLVTNLPEARSAWYGQRMWEELAFRDLKSAGWEWGRSRVWDPEHANRLWLVMAVAYAWALSLGTRVVRTPALRQAFTRGKARRWNVFRLGLRYLLACLGRGRPPPTRLAFVPHSPSSRKMSSCKLPRGGRLRCGLYRPYRLRRP